MCEFVFSLFPMYLNVFHLKALRREIGIWKRLRHDCIVSLLGTAALYSPMSIVSSWMPNGTLMSYLQNDHVQKSLTKKYDLVSLSSFIDPDLTNSRQLYNVADGLKYCQYCNHWNCSNTNRLPTGLVHSQSVVHGDLTSVCFMFHVLQYSNELYLTE